MSEIIPGPDPLVRYFVLTLGRTGSSLLAATLADAGADFGIDVPGGWDPRTGQMEGRDIKIAAHHYRRAYDISIGRKYVLSPAIETKIRVQRARRHLKRALTRGRFLKIGDLDLVVQPSFKLGYSPRVILNYRQLELNLPSLLVGRTHVGPDQLAEEYVRIYRQGLSLLKTFGGCTVAYNELQDLHQRGWAKALSSITQLDEEKLVESRKVRLKGTIDTDDVRPIYSQAYALYEQMRALEGQAIAPSRQVARTLSD
ncbi:MAG: hypothetical protein ACI9BW_003387 [Gammaproteobacteria bacterium]|jgi:hypothetical protein